MCIKGLLPWWQGPQRRHQSCQRLCSLSVAPESQSRLWETVSFPVLSHCPVFGYIQWEGLGMRLHNILWGCVSQSDNGQRPCYPVQVMFNGQRSCLYNLTLHVLRSQFLLQQFDLQREKEMKIKSKLNVSKSTVMCLQWLRKTPVNFGVVSVQVKREEVNNVVTDPPLSRMMANTCIANIQCTSQTPSHTVFLEPQGISLIPRPPPCHRVLVSFPGLPRFYLLFAVTIIHGSRRPVKNGKVIWMLSSECCQVDMRWMQGGGQLQTTCLDR